MDPNTANKTDRTYEIVAGVIVLLVIIILCAWLLVRHHETMMMSGVASSTTEVASSTTATTTASGSTTMPQQSPSQVVSGDAITAVNQSAGMSVMIQSVALTQRSWVAITDAKGVVLGAALFPAGTHTDVSVPLLHGTVAGGQYVAIIYVDAGNKVFDLHTDSLVMSSAGSMLGSSFEAQ